MSAPKRTIDEFVRIKRRANCPVCKTKPEIRAAITDARRKRFQVPIILEWIKSEYGVSLTAAQIRFHFAGQHDGKDGLGR